MSGHTEGPWIAFCNADTQIVCMKEFDGKTLALCDEDRRIPLAERQANAALIASAPRMQE